MNDRVVDLLQELGKQLGVAADHLWRVLVIGQRAEGIAHLVMALMLALGLVLGMRAIWKIEDWSDSEPVPHMGFAILCGSWILVLFWIYDGVLALAAPEYAALKFMLRRLGGN